MALKAGLLLLLAAGLTSTSPWSAQTARGTVFDDQNQNGILDEGEAGLEGVRVSNGEEVVVTDAQGRWSLEVGEEEVIFVTKPSGWATPMNEHMLPRFYYLHQPAGSPPGMRYAGIDPTGPLPESIDFPLTRSEEASLFEVLLFSDTQPQSEVELDYFREDVVNELIASVAAFGMTLGDIMFDDLSLFPRFNALVARIGIPWYNVPGNHELNFEAVDDRHSLETFKRFFGPPYYSFEYGDALFVVLDNIEYRGGGASDPGDVRGNGGYIANLGERQLRWLKQELSHVPREKLVFLAMHAPLETYSSPQSKGTNTQDRAALFELLAGRPNLYSVAGHTHTTEHHYFDSEDGFAGPGTFHHHVLATVSGSWWSGPFDERGIPTSIQRDGTPNGYHLLEVDGAHAALRFRAAGKPVDYQMRISFDVAHHGLSPDAYRDFRSGELFDGRLNKDAVPAAEILVNLFDGGPRSEVAFQVDDGPLLPMARVSRADPHVLESFSRHAESKKSWVEALPSSHLWSADLPDQLGPGTYTITIRAEDEFGRVHHAHTVLEVTG